MDFTNNSNLQDYLRRKEIEEAAKKTSRKRIVEEQNKKKWLDYQQHLRNTLNGSGYLQSSVEYITDNLVLYYDAGVLTSYSGSGASIYDLSGNSRTGTISGSTDWSTGYFTFSNDSIVTPDLDQIITTASEAHSVEVWVYPTNNGVIASYLGTEVPNDNYHFAAIELVSGQVEFGLWNGTAITSTGPTGALTLNEWHQLVLTYNGHGSPVKGYIDGVLVSQTSNMNFQSPMDDLTPKFCIAFGALDGTNQGDGSYFDGRIGVMRVYKKQLSADEVLRNYARHVGYYKR
jgi:hypothetical protein